MTNLRGGMDYNTTLKTVKSFLLLFPGEVAGASQCRYWDKSTPLGMEAYRARKQSYAIIKSLWPSHLGGAFASPGLPSFDDFESEFVLPNFSRSECDAGSKDAQSDVAFQLAVSHKLAERPCYIWSIIHFLMHNQPDAMSRIRVGASRTLAIHLSEQFWCTNCRGYFTEGILELHGLPPQSSDPTDHAAYWNFGHNIASEHVATTRGDDPWQYQLGEDSVKDFQNPFYLSFETAVQMWTYDDRPKQ